MTAAVSAPHGAADPAPTLTERLTRYLEVRRHTLSTAHLPYLDKIRGEADYVLGEASELLDAIYEYAAVLNGDPSDMTAPEAVAHARHELADVVLAATVLAGLLGTTVEDCIDEKTEADRGRG